MCKIGVGSDMDRQHSHHSDGDRNNARALRWLLSEMIVPCKAQTQTHFFSFLKPATEPSYKTNDSPVSGFFREVIYPGSAERGLGRFDIQHLIISFVVFTIDSLHIS